jgi:hypothetical protein
MATPGTWPFCPSANIQATRITRAGFMNSDGCRVKPPNSSQRVAPLALWPMNGRMIMMATAASQMKNEARRTTFTSSIDVPIRITAAAAAKTHCRTAKWKGSPTFIRAAAAGLAANDMATPMKIRIASTPSIQRSTVHHQMPMEVRSAREKAWAWGELMQRLPGRVRGP